jgi:hypothetical protein
MAGRVLTKPSNSSLAEKGPGGSVGHSSGQNPRATRPAAGSGLRRRLAASRL